MKIGLIKETKIPIDNRVALSPAEAAALQQEFPDSQIVVESSNIRAYSDDEYRQAGIQVVSDLSDCDVLFGIKEAAIESLIPNKHYFFFGHIAKKQAYNRPLIQALMKKGITFSDYEYLVDDAGKRVCAFGWWAGIVGAYYTLRGYGLRYHTFSLPKPNLKFTLEKLTAAFLSVQLPAIKIIITGNGRVSQGAQYILDKVGAKRLTQEQFLSSDTVCQLSYTVADVDTLVRPIDDSQSFTFDHFLAHPEQYKSDFMRFAKSADMLLCGHFWAPNNPVYLTQDDFLEPDFRIKMIGDITCDIMGSVQSTLRSSTHDDPFYDYNPVTRQEEPAFSNENNITIEAVDTCPNALAIDTSAYFGEMLTKYVFRPLLSRQDSPIITRSTILDKGELTPRFDYLTDFAKGK